MPPRSTPMMRRCGMAVTICGAIVGASGAHLSAAVLVTIVGLDAGQTTRSSAQPTTRRTGSIGESGSDRSASEERPYTLYRSTPRGLRVPPARRRRRRGVRGRAARVGANGGSGGRRSGRRRDRWPGRGAVVAARGAAQLAASAASGWRWRSSPGWCCRASCSSSPPRSRAARSPIGPECPAFGLEHGHRHRHGARARHRSAAEGVQGAGRVRRAGSALTRSCCGGSAAAPRGGCRSPVTRSPTSPAIGQSKINAAYAYGGPALAIKTVEAVHRGQGQPSDHRQPRQLPEVHRRDRRGRRHHRPDLLEHQRRRQERRVHAEPAARRPTT